MNTEFIYHYTTLESLACILKYKTIRFSRLDKMNDPLEGGILQGISKHVFSSSWSLNSEESIPLWKMYTSMTGVRIKISSGLFNEDNQEREFVEGDIVTAKSTIKPIYLRDRDFDNIIDHVYGPIRVRYIDKFTTFPSLTLAKRKPLTIITEKRKHWMYEDEVRFVLIPHCDSGPRFIQWHSQYSNSDMDRHPNEEYIDIPFNEDVLNSIEILKAPLFTAGQEILLQSVLTSYAPEAKVLNSTIKISS